MKKKLINRNVDVCTDFRDTFADIRTPFFRGTACLHTMLSVSRPLIKKKPIPPPNRFRIADKGYAWLTLLPEGEDFALTGILDKTGRVLQVYVDLILDKGENWFLDAYADVILFEDRRVFVDDLDELEQAAETGELKREQANQIRRRAEALANDMRRYPQRWFCLVEHAADILRKKEASL